MFIELEVTCGGVNQEPGETGKGDGGIEGEGERGKGDGGVEGEGEKGMGDGGIEEGGEEGRGASAKGWRRERRDLRESR